MFRKMKGWRVTNQTRVSHLGLSNRGEGFLVLAIPDGENQGYPSVLNKGNTILLGRWLIPGGHERREQRGSFFFN